MSDTMDDKAMARTCPTCGQLVHERETRGLDYVKIVGPGVDALENRKEAGSPVDLENEVNAVLRRGLEALIKR